MASHPTSFRFDDETWQLLESLRERRGLSATAAIRAGLTLLAEQLDVKLRAAQVRDEPKRRRRP